MILKDYKYFQPGRIKWESKWAAHVLPVVQTSKKLGWQFSSSLRRNKMASLSEWWWRKEEQLWSQKHESNRSQNQNERFKPHERIYLSNAIFQSWTEAKCSAGYSSSGNSDFRSPSAIIGISSTVSHVFLFAFFYFWILAIHDGGQEQQDKSERIREQKNAQLMILVREGIKCVRLPPRLSAYRS